MNHACKEFLDEEAHSDLVEMLLAGNDYRANHRRGNFRTSVQSIWRFNREKYDDAE